MNADPALSILDLIPVATGRTTGDALAASLSLAKAADAAGYRRYWVAEHHNTGGVASTAPGTIIGLLASATARIRVGSGGVMLPNHAPLAVAEQFALLEAAFPGRVDLGIGRAPGTDPVTSWALRAGASEQDAVSAFDRHVQQVVAYMSPAGASVRIQGRDFAISATPSATSEPEIWLLGSSDYSARLAARLGLAYVFAHHFSGVGTQAALDLYRREFAGPGEPRTFLTVNAATADADAAAERAALPFQHAMARIRTGSTRGPMPTIEEAKDLPLPMPPDAFAAISAPWLVGTPDDVASGVVELARHFEVDEVMIQPIGGASELDPPGRIASREHTVVELATALTRRHRWGS